MSGLLPSNLLSDDGESEYESRRLLEELGDELESATAGRICGEVRTSYPHRQQVEHMFSLRAVRTNYRYDLFWLTHSLDEFPLQLRGPWHDEARCDSLEELRDQVHAMFGDVRVRRLINQLARQGD